MIAAHDRRAMITANGLCVELGGRAVLHDLSLTLGAGWTAIVGPNGAGKSTLLRALAGLLPAAAGGVQLDGRALRDHSARSRGRLLAWLAQQGEAVGDLRAIDIVRLGRLPHHGLWASPAAADETAVQEAMAETEATPFASRRLNELSGGERQRVLLARALAVQAPVLLLDEPTSHLDAPHQRALLAGLLRRARAGAVVVTVLHDLSLALAADRVVVVAGGQIVADGPPADAALQAALAEVFDHAFTIESVQANGRQRWVALPAVDRQPAGADHNPT
jgi:iron complex transport system ATP-binding protein